VDDVVILNTKTCNAAYEQVKEEGSIKPGQASKFVRSPPPPPANGIEPWEIPSPSSSLLCNTSADLCSFIEVEKTVEVELFKSHSVLDDMAFGAVWMYMATGESEYIGASQKYLERHYLVRRISAVHTHLFLYCTHIYALGQNKTVCPTMNESTY
jgi:hypothetical protein